MGTTPDGERIEHIGTVDPDISPDDFQAFVEGDKPAATMATKKGEGRRLRFEHEGRLVYEWEQSLDEVNIYITPPEGLSAKMIEVDIKHGHLRIGIKGQAEGKSLTYSYHHRCYCDDCAVRDILTAPLFSSH